MLNESGRGMDISGTRVISIDDNKTNQMLVENYAKSLRLEVHSFEDSLERLKADEL